MSFANKANEFLQKHSNLRDLMFLTQEGDVQHDVTELLFIIRSGSSVYVFGQEVVNFYNS